MKTDIFLDQRFGLVYVSTCEPLITLLGSADQNMSQAWLEAYITPSLPTPGAWIETWTKIRMGGHMGCYTVNRSAGISGSSPRPFASY